MSDPRVALVTGSARGMGRAMAEVLAASGHRVVGLDRLDQERGLLERIVAADLADVAVPAQVVADILATEGRLDVLVHNAAVYVPTHPLRRGHARGLRPADLGQPARRVLPVAGRRRGDEAQRLGPDHRHLQRRGADWRRLQLGRSTTRPRPGVISLMKNFARNYGRYGITANAVAPGAIEGFMTAHMTAAERARLHRASCPSAGSPNRSRSPTSSASWPPTAASYVNGATIDVNGGWVMT